MVTPEQGHAADCAHPVDTEQVWRAVWALPGKKRRNVLRRRGDWEIVPRFSSPHPETQDGLGN